MENELPPIRIIDEFSPCAVPLQLFCNDHKIGSATGFFWERDGDIYLVSNWHVFSGREPSTGQPKDSDGAIPDKIRFPAFARDFLNRYTETEVSLCEAKNEARWLHHPTAGQSIDVAACKLNFPLNHAVYPTVVFASWHDFHPINRKPLVVDMRVYVGLDVFILGFPLGLMKTAIFPVWKRGSIATEPQFDIDDLPCFLVDTATRSGMSGSPVILRAQAGYLASGGAYNVVPGATSFLGIYSGRIGGGEDKAQLGFVWKGQVVDEIIDGKARGSYELRTPIKK